MTRLERLACEGLAKRDKLHLHIFWLKDDDHIDPDSLPPPDEVVAAIVENLEQALEKFRSVALALARTVEAV
jgi:type I restriction enzyme M protein